MKKMHQVAHIKEGNKRIGYILKEGDPRNYSPWYLCDEETFIRAVSNNQIQYFVADAQGNPTVSYTQEEMLLVNQLGSLPYTGKEYWSRDISFKKSSIDFMTNNKAVIINPTSAMQMMWIKVITIVAFCPTSIAPLFEQFIRGYLGNSMYANTLRCGGNNFVFSITSNNIKGKNNIFDRAKQAGLNLITDCNTLQRVSSIPSQSVISKVTLPSDKIQDIISTLKAYELS